LARHWTEVPSHATAHLGLDQFKLHASLGKRHFMNVFQWLVEVAAGVNESLTKAAMPIVAAT
jgi:hypothetical protein